MPEGLGGGGEAESDRLSPHRKGPPQRVDEIPAIAFGKLVGTIAEHDEGRRAGVYLGDVAELNALPFGRGGRFGVDLLLEPAAERPGRDPLDPCLAQLESDLEDLVDALPGLRRHG